MFKRVHSVVYLSLSGKFKLFLYKNTKTSNLAKEQYDTLPKFWKGVYNDNAQTKYRSETNFNLCSLDSKIL
jgi:hypothetical protein